MLSLLACFSLSFFKNWISSLVPSLNKLFLVSFNVLLSSPNTFSMLPFFFILFRDCRSGTNRFRLVLDDSSFTPGELDELLSLTETWYDKSFPDMFGLAWCSMALGSIACPRCQLPIVTTYCISLLNNSPELVLTFKAAVLHAATQRWNFWRVWFISNGNTSPRSTHLFFNSFTMQSIYWPFFAFFVFAISNFCLHLSFSTIISTRSFTRVSLHWNFLPFFFNLLFFLRNTLHEFRSPNSLDSSPHLL